MSIENIALLSIFVVALALFVITMCVAYQAVHFRARCNDLEDRIGILEDAHIPAGTIVGPGVATTVVTHAGASSGKREYVDPGQRL